MSPLRKPPHSVHVLQRWIAENERESGVAVARQQRWVSYMILAAILDRVRDGQGQPLLLLKGGRRPRTPARPPRPRDQGLRHVPPPVISMICPIFSPSLLLLDVRPIQGGNLDQRLELDLLVQNPNDRAARRDASDGTA